MLNVFISQALNHLKGTILIILPKILCSILYTLVALEVVETPMHYLTSRTYGVCAT